MKVNRDCKRLFLWSGPRNISTTLMYSFAQRTDTVVYDEPLYGAYLKGNSVADYHPDAGLIMESMDCDYQSIIGMMLGSHKKPVAFFKNMAHHLIDVDRSFMDCGFHIILTRNPKEMLPSFDKVISNPTIKDVGYKAHIDLVAHLERNELAYAIIDATLLLKSPEHVLKQLCELIGISFDQGMMSWPIGPCSQDGVWAKHWYKKVHASTGYRPYNEKVIAFPKHLLPLLQECEPYYHELLIKALV